MEKNQNIALTHLLQSISDIHLESKSKGFIEDGIDYFDFDIEELKGLIAALWEDRYTNSRESFKDEVGKIITEKMNNAD